MDPKSLDQIHRFTASVDHADLYAYLDIEPDAEKATIIHALQVRRSWAQGQQANPKYRNEALWVIKNIKMLTQALTTSSSLYKSDVAARDEQEKLETLSIFIKGTLADGDLTARGEEAIQKQGELLGLTESTVIRRVGEILAERDANQHAEATDTPLSSFEIHESQDLYEVLDTPPDSDQETLERAYRERYRWARQLQDRNKSSRVYALLDEAWRVLKDPERRAKYDAERAEQQELGPQEEQAAIGLLPPPPPIQGLALPMPTVEKHLEKIESGVDFDAPSIAMPAAVSERDAPPPPVVPPQETSATSDNIFSYENAMDSSDLEEPDLSIDDDEGEDLVFRMPSSIEAPVVEPMMGFEGNDLPQSEGLSDTEKALASLEGLPDGMGLADIQKMATMTDLDDAEIPPDDGQEEQPNTFPAPDGLTDFGMGKSLQMEPPDRVTPTLPAAPESLPVEDEDTDEGYLATGQLFNDDAVLQVDSPKTIRIRTGSNPFPVRITILNAGDGQMPGKISTNVDWVQLSPRTLDPNRSRQVIEALVEPDAMPGNSAKAVVTIDTDHGETRTITIDALKHVVSPLMMFVSALSLIGLVGVFLGLYFSGVIGSDVSTPERTILAINVDPPAGEVYINDRLVGNQGTLSLVDTFPINTPFQVRVELDGFEPFLREVTVPIGTQFRLEADLILRDGVDFRPTEDMSRSVIDQNALDLAIEQRQNAMNACFTRNLRTMTPFQADIQITSVVTARGAIEGIQFGDANFRSPAVEICLRRQLRAIQLPLLAGDYAEFTRTFSAEIRPTSAINEGEQ